MDKLTNNEYIIVIGGANIDLCCIPYNNLLMNDSNPGNMKMSVGGVGRNIAENLARLGDSVKLITLLGEDDFGEKIIRETSAAKVDMSYCETSKSDKTSTYVSILDKNGDMALAFCDMKLYDNIDNDFIEKRRDLISNSSLCIVDTNLPQNILDYLCNNFNETIFFADTVSCTKAMKIKNVLHRIHTIKPNKLEAEILTGVSINSESDCKKASDYFLNRGVKRVFITMGALGVFYDDGEKFGLMSAPKVEIVNATGAGDAFTAALAHCYINKLDIINTTRFAMGASYMALTHENTINDNISEEKINNLLRILRSR